MPDSVQKTIDQHFGSVDNFKSEFLGNANAIFGGGFVWLVSHRTSIPGSVNKTTRQLKILRTYNAGSPLAGNHWRQQSKGADFNDMFKYAEKQFDLQNAITSDNMTKEEKDRAIRKVAEDMGADQTISRTVQNIKEHSTAHDIQPILCVSVWEHSYIVDWRVNNKRQYLEAWWDRIDWQRVLKYGPFDQYT
jgi:Fe-Mn family superoxide dismutase